MSRVAALADEAPSSLPLYQAVRVFLAFALAYFVSTLLRAVTATLAPALGAEMQLQASDLGLLAGGYFVGFAATQLPMGALLDRHGPRRVILAFLAVAVAGCAGFALATGFSGLLLARVVIGMGVSACLMAPLTGYRRWLVPAMQLRANAWMLMIGSFGMVAATLPVQWLLPQIGWRGVFWVLAVLLAVAMVVLAGVVPSWQAAARPLAGGDTAVGYAQIVRHPYFLMMAPVGGINHGGMVAMQTLWAGPWMTRLGGASAEAAAAGLFAINLAMLVAYWLWGTVTPALARRGLTAERTVAIGAPLGMAMLAWVLWRGADAGWPAWAAYCVATSCLAQAQPAVAMAMPAQAAGRALSAYNLVVFAGIFVVQWGVGLAIDALRALGWGEAASYRGAVGLYLLACVAGYAMFWHGWRRVRRATLAA
jgi:MFS family permease